MGSPVKRMKGLFIWLWFFFFLQAGALGFLRPYLGLYLSPILLLVSSVAFFLVGIRIASFISSNGDTGRTDMKPATRLRLPALFVFLIGAGWLWLRMHFDSYPIDPRQSDIIPHLQVLVNRFRNSQFVYDDVTNFGYTIYPNYPTMTWMPFVAAEWFQLDYRTWAHGILSFILLLYLLFLSHKGWGGAWLVLTAGFSFWYFLNEHPSSFGWTIEPMIAAFYALVILGLYLRQTPVIVLAFVLCLLSRYTLAIWLPFALLLLFIFDHKKNAGITFFLVTAGVLLLFILPFVSFRPDIIIKGLEYYHTCAIDEWRGQSWQQPGAIPHQLGQGLGFAYFFYQHGSGDIGSRLRQLQVCHFLVVLLLPMLLAAWYYFKGKSHLPLNWFLILSLNLYLAVFFILIQVPYAYLFFTSLFTTSCITGLLMLQQFRSSGR